MLSSRRVYVVITYEYFYRLYVVITYLHCLLYLTSACIRSTVEVHAGELRVWYVSRKLVSQSVMGNRKIASSTYSSLPAYQHTATR
jgi:hypothetical protein